MTFDLLLGNADLEIARVAPVLAVLRGGLVYDTAQSLRRDWGWLAHGLDEITVADWKSEFAKKGIETRILPAAGLWQAPLPVQITNLSLERQTVTLANGDEVNQPWHELDLVASCRMVQTTVRTSTSTQGPSTTQRIASAGILLATGLPIRIGPKAKKEVKSERSEATFFCVDLIAMETNRRYRVIAQEFDYAALGGLKGLGALGNAKTLVKELVRRAPQSTQNFGTTQVLKNSQEAGSHGSLEEFEKEETWLMNLRGADRRLT